MNAGSFAKPFAAHPPLTVALGAAAGCVGLAAIGPTDDGIPLCPTKLLFEIDCPLCGGLRTAAALGRLDVAAALDHNVFVMVLLAPLTVVWWVLWVMRRRSDPNAAAPGIPTRLMWAIIAIGSVFTVARNTVGGSLGTFLRSAAG